MRTYGLAETLPDSPLGSAWNLIWVLFVLGVVIALIVLILRFIAKRSRGWGMNRALRSLGGYPLGTNKSMQIVEWNGRIYVLGVGPGETSFYAMDDRDQVIYSASVHVSNNIDQIRSLLRAALPEASITVEPFNGMVMLSGQVPSPEAVGEAEHLVKQLLGEKQVVVNRLRAATPVQVNLQVKIAEVSRTLLKEVGFNLATRDATGGFLFGVWRGRSAVEITDKGYEFLVPEGTNTIGLAGKLFGLDAAAAIDALAEEGLVTILAEPNLTALSGEMASFLAGGEFAIPMPAENGRVLIEYKQYGVGLAFTPTVMSDNRITLRVRPEVSELSQAGAISVNGISVPRGLTQSPA